MTHPDARDFYIGREYDLKEGKISGGEVMYNPSDLTTHAVVTGMTGSGKTGLCIGLLEEAALKGLPAIIVDPKGDLTNLLLHFPDLAPSDFEPWIDLDSARIKGKSARQMAEEAATSWSTSIDDWGLSKGALSTLKAFSFAIYSPGSSSGIPVNILSSFKAPGIPWEGNEEALREKISSTVTAVLGLVGMKDIDPLRSREHILMSSILEHAWALGEDLSLTDLILRVQSPQMERLGAFPVETFFPEKDRMALAMLLNNFLASPSFRVWQQGQPLDVEELLYTDDKKPRHSIFYLAHLSENERMFFVTLLFSAVESWMRRQRGTSGLRALVYFDEILGYLPPVSNPPSRNVMLRMIKQARAFGVGLLLVTQNPVDLDYKALSNIGTWFIGRLQTERDKMRLMDGLQTLTGGMDANTIGDTISSLGKRVFLMNNVNRPGPKVFHARQVLNYLAGPLSKDLLPDLNKLAGAEYVPSEGSCTGGAANGAALKEDDGFLRIKPAVPSKVDEAFMPLNLDAQDAIRSAGSGMPSTVKPDAIAYAPAMIVQAEVRYSSIKYGIDLTDRMTSLVEDDPSGRPDWQSGLINAEDLKGFGKDPASGALFEGLPAWLSDQRLIKSASDDFADWLYRNSRISILANEGLKLYAKPDDGKDGFLERCLKEADRLMVPELDKLEDVFRKKKDALEDKIRKQEGEVQLREQNVSQRTMEAIGTAGTAIFGMLLGGKKRSLGSSITKTRMTTEAKSVLTREKKELQDMMDDLAELDREFDRAQEGLAAAWKKKAEMITEVPCTPRKSDIFISFFGVVWLPQYIFKEGAYTRRLRAFALEPKRIVRAV